MMPTSLPERRFQFRAQKVISPNPEWDEVLMIDDRTIEEDYLVIMVDIANDQVCLINLDTTARAPIRISYQKLMHCIDDERVLLADMSIDPRLLLDEEHLSDGFKKKAQKRLKEIFPLIQDIESVLRNGYGDKLFEDIAQQTGRSKQYIYDTFYSYLRSGGRQYCLGLPQGKNANHIPKQREIRVKQGAPNTDIPRGKVLDEYDYKAFEFGKRLYEKNGVASLKKTLRQIWEKHYVANRVKLTAHEAMRSGIQYAIELMPPQERPTYDQFLYWLKNQYGGSLPKQDRNKRSNTEYKASKAGRKGDGFKNILAPGQEYQLDETPFNEEVVSIFDLTRTTKLGKPTIYFVRDTFSWAIAGIYITTQNPSYATAKEALFNAARDKAGFLEEINCPIDAALWPIKGVPQTLLVDRAEFHNILSEGPITDLMLTIKFTRAGRGDDKGHIETMFQVFLSYFRGLSKGLQTKSLHDIAKQVARKNACLTINELYIIAVVYAVYFNSKKVMDRYPLTREMVADKVMPIPNELYRWGMENRPGGLTDMSEGELYFRLCEKGRVSVHRTHILLLDTGLHYNCAWTLETGLQDRKESGNRAERLPCRYHRGLVDVIFIWTTDGPKLATLDIQDQRFEGLSFPEVKLQKDKERKEYALSGEEDLNGLASAEAFARDMVQHAQKERQASTIPALAKIKENRGYESVFDRIIQTNRFVLAVQKEFLLLDDTASNPVANLALKSPYKALDIPDELFEEHDELDDFYDDEDA